MRRAAHLLIPLCVVFVMCGVEATAHPTSPNAVTADVTSVVRPARARWESRRDRPIRVYIRPAPAVPGWRSELGDAAWASFARWATSRVPVRFTRSRTAAAADVVVEWVEGLPGNCIGRTWRQDVGTEISAARITLALYDRRGRLLAPEIQHGAMLHEIGHLLGLEHAHERDSIMYPQVWVTEVSEADRDALRALYAANRRAGAD